MHFRFTGDCKLSADMNVACLYVALPSPYDSWERLQQTQVKPEFRNKRVLKWIDKMQHRKRPKISAIVKNSSILFVVINIEFLTN